MMRFSFLLIASFHLTALKNGLDFLFHAVSVEIHKKYFLIKIVWDVSLCKQFIGFYWHFNQTFFYWLSLENPDDFENICLRFSIWQKSREERWGEFWSNKLITRPANYWIEQRNIPHHFAARWFNLLIMTMPRSQVTAACN